MSRTTRNHATGIYQFRKRVPEHLIPLLGKREEKVSLGTRDPQEAKIAHARILARTGQVAAVGRGSSFPFPEAGCRHVRGRSVDQGQCPLKDYCRHCFLLVCIARESCLPAVRKTKEK
ncbi:DUF6538 domain-containing protein [Rhizobium indicum]|uniref:DUF6538 domain-containing protein n=1 Tax=Rhizobium indicum TaxID=2583231 RepID=UPI003CCE0783